LNAAGKGLRLFYALWPDDDMRAQVAAAAVALRLEGDVRCVPRANFHVTLAFVGEVAASQVATMRRVGCGQRAAACTIKFDAYEYWREPQVVVAAARDTPATLDELCSRLHRDLSLPPPAALRPHVTLARKVTQAPVAQAMSPFFWSARSFSLIHSDTSGARSVYTVVDTWSLLDETSKA
jgi:RNA 2',3'-cyclic 3'-phosphodiesterase